MWKAKRPESVHTQTEKKLEQRDQTIRGMIDELIKGAEELKTNTRQLKTTYTGETVDRPDPAKPS